jgi:hypothetical protein
MEERRGGSEGCRGWVLHPEAVAQIIEQALRDDAWWVAARSGRYVQGTTVWADCVRPKVSIPRIFQGDDLEALLRRGSED